MHSRKEKGEGGKERGRQVPASHSGRACVAWLQGNGCLYLHLVSDPRSLPFHENLTLLSNILMFKETCVKSESGLNDYFLYNIGSNKTNTPFDTQPNTCYSGAMLEEKRPTKKGRRGWNYEVSLHLRASVCEVRTVKQIANLYWGLSVCQVPCGTFYAYSFLFYNNLMIHSTTTSFYCPPTKCQKLSWTSGEEQQTEENNDSALLRLNSG